MMILKALFQIVLVEYLCGNGNEYVVVPKPKINYL